MPSCGACAYSSFAYQSEKNYTFFAVELCCYCRADLNSTNICKLEISKNMCTRWMCVKVKLVSALNGRSFFICAVPYSAFVVMFFFSFNAFLWMGDTDIWWRQHTESYLQNGKKPFRNFLSIWNRTNRKSRVPQQRQRESERKRKCVNINHGAVPCSCWCW